MEWIWLVLRTPKPTKRSLGYSCISTDDNFSIMRLVYKRRKKKRSQTWGVFLFFFQIPTRSCNLMTMITYYLWWVICEFWGENKFPKNEKSLYSKLGSHHTLQKNRANNRKREVAVLCSPFSPYAHAPPPAIFIWYLYDMYAHTPQPCYAWAMICPSQPKSLSPQPHVQY